MKKGFINTTSIINTNKNKGKTILRFFIGSQQVQYDANKEAFTIDRREITWRIESIPANDIYLLEISSPNKIKTFRKLSENEIEDINDLLPSPVIKKV